MRQAFKRFWASARGNVALVFALSIIPFMVLAGFAVDVGRAILVRERLGHALDAAILAVGAAPYLTNEQAQAFGEEFFHANFDNTLMGAAYDIEVNVLGDVVTMSAHARVPTTILAMLNHENIDLYLESEAMRGGQDLELVMVLDNTFSMTMPNSKINNLRIAAAEATTTIFAAAGSDPEAVKIGLVPFAGSVNVGPQHERAWWLDPNALSSAHANNFSWNASVNRWDLYDELGVEWEGCVEARPEPYDMNDTAPSAGTPNTLFVPYFAPDVPGNRNSASTGYTNTQSWISDGEFPRAMTLGSPNTGLSVGQIALKALGLLPGLGLGVGTKYNTNAAARQAYAGKYYETTQSPYGRGPNLDCINHPLTPMTTNEDLLIDEIEDMQALSTSGYTNIPNGIIWGLRVLSSNEPFTEGSPWGTDELVKAMIILTDGENLMSGQTNAAMSTYTSYGFIAEGRFGITTNNSDLLADRLDMKTTQVCNYAKGLGARIYTITLEVGDAATRTMMQNCASTNQAGDQLYWDSPSSSQLQQIFRAIARDLVDLRLTR
jgi:Flp pilus assembly protein TadG